MSIPDRKGIKLRSALIAQIETLEHQAHRLRMTVTAHALNNAKNSAGWECAGNILAAGMASRGERHDDVPRRRDARNEKLRSRRIGA